MKYILITAIAALIAFISIPKLAISEDHLPPVQTPVVVDIGTVIHMTFPDAPIMYQVAKAESWDYKSQDFNPKAKNPASTAKGIFQILDGTWKGAGCKGDPLQALDNIACARKIYDDSGTRPWDASKGTWGKFVVR